MSTFTAPDSIGDFNKQIAALGIPVTLKPDNLSAFFEDCTDENGAGRERVVKALCLASNPSSQYSLNALTFLKKKLEPYAAAPAPRSTVTSIKREAQAPSEASETAQTPRNAPQAAQRAQPPVQAPQREREAATTERWQVKAFGKRAALCVESDVTRRGVPTVRFEFATATGERQYDWGNKLTVQLTQDEIIQAAAVMFGFVASVDFKNHGDDAKWLSIQHQGTGIFIKGGSSAANSLRGVPVDVGRSTALAALLCAQLNKALFGAGDNGTLMPLLRNVAANLMTGTPQRKAG